MKQDSVTLLMADSLVAWLSKIWNDIIIDDLFSSNETCHIDKNIWWVKMEQNVTRYHMVGCVCVPQFI